MRVPIMTLLILALIHARFIHVSPAYPLVAEVTRTILTVMRNVTYFIAICMSSIQGGAMAILWQNAHWV